ncbi:MAG: PEP-CTERM sorting domain-containing protein [Rhodothermia bacterium]
MPPSGLPCPIQPEPSTILLVGMGAMFLAGAGRFHRQGRGSCDRSFHPRQR